MEVLGRFCDVSKETIRAIEKGEQAPRIETTMRLAIALGVAIEDLLPADWRTTYAPGAWLPEGSMPEPSDVAERPAEYAHHDDDSGEAELAALRALHPDVPIGELRKMAYRSLLEAGAAARVKALAGTLSIEDLSVDMRRRDRMT